MVKGNAHEILQASLNRLQNEGLYKEVLGFLSERCNFKVYDVDDLKEEEAKILTIKIRDRKKTLKQMEKVRYLL